MYSFIILISIIIGISLRQLEVVRLNAESFILPLLIAMLYITFLQLPFENIKSALKNVKFTYATILMNFVWTPVLAWLLALLFLSDNPALWIGFIMLMVTPCTDWYLIFTGIAKGNVALSTTILPINLILQILLLPVYLLIFSSTTVNLDFSIFIESIFLVLLIPLLLAFITKRILNNMEQIKEKIGPTMSILPTVFLSLAIVAMFAAKGQLLLDHLDLIWKIIIPILSFFIINFIIGQKVGSALKFSYYDKTSFSMTTLARNSPIALAIAMTAFLDQPLIALILVVGPLLELPILAGITQVLLLNSSHTKKVHLQ